MDIIPDPRIQVLQPEWFFPYVQEVAMLRLDEVHPIVSGNKWFKLKRNITHAIQQGCETILTFGGGYSNHLVATAAAAKEFGLKSVGVVRGVYEQLTPTLVACQGFDMLIEFVSQDEYDRKDDETWLKQLTEKYEKVFVVPEGGANDWGREGAAEIAGFIPSGYTHVCVSVGTGTTLEGIRKALSTEVEVFGYVPMKGGTYLTDEISKHVPSNANWLLFDEWHFGGFGKRTDGLISFMNEFYSINHIPLDMVYTAKMMYGVQAQMKAGVFPPDASILCIHTGGLQGNSSIAERLVY
ncbi:1-aminocyclopropane-1-carboxylate deaminase/D-cysteine desulfhydrase [Polluticoccus soli]|uniref:1-aminocyclopropane-1-carboxylate deaminase/D-cysteine desulfhydrase n=1 Tax=Polluticoccus soli TaxID=3034150 RepID=UPI0023E22728|nr:pyridoxal-phosphate dependent enzyme [Flavipsychrobacter sp. JY13-12]